MAAAASRLLPRPPGFKNPYGYCNHGPNGMTCPIGVGSMPGRAVADKVYDATTGLNYAGVCPVSIRKDRGPAP
jgi:hypothetical protein